MNDLAFEKRISKPSNHLKKVSEDTRYIKCIKYCTD